MRTPRLPAATKSARRKLALFLLACDQAKRLMPDDMFNGGTIQGRDKQRVDVRKHVAVPSCTSVQTQTLHITYYAHIASSYLTCTWYSAASAEESANGCLTEPFLVQEYSSTL